MNLFNWKMAEEEINIIGRNTTTEINTFRLNYKIMERIVDPRLKIDDNDNFLILGSNAFRVSMGLKSLFK